MANETGFTLIIDDKMINKLDAADKKIEQLQKTSDKTSVSVISAFKQMAVGIDPFIAKLSEANKILSKMSAPNISVGGFSNMVSDAERTATAVGNITVALNKGLSAQEQERKIQIDKYSMYQRMFDSIDKNEKRQEQSYQRELDRITKLQDAQERKTQAEQKAQERLQQSQQRTAQKAQQRSDNTAFRAEEQYRNSLNKTEITIANRARKIEALANAERALTQTGRNYTTEITKIRTETERLNRANEEAIKSTNKIKASQSNLIDTSSQLERKLALLFSVSQIEGYIMKLVNIRGEFELQNRSLQAILQNKDEANKLFEQITELAIRSPFRVKELVTYTKELAAYRIETEKLYDTTKMLADVSAGLGVDMSRLILAYGQVKAANYLRGTELRQFSEAGINILGELSTYFTELEGRVVSVGDVFERVTKRMVSFGDVEEIFKRITSEGGIFYNMQEIQAETLQGQISNLYDSIDIMFNEIGKANDGTLKDTVALLRNMVENWELIANTIVPVITAFAAYKGIIFALIGYEKLMLALRTVSNTQLALQNTLLVKSANGQNLFNIASKANPYLIVGAFLVSAIMGIYNSIKSAREEQEKFNKAVSEGVTSASEMAANFKRLADIATDSSKSTKEQTDALIELKRTYSDILPLQTFQIENLKAMKGNYDSVTSAIYAKIEAQTKENLAQDIQNEYGKKAADATDELIKKLKQLNISADASRTILAEFRKRFDEGFINSPQKAQVELKNLIKAYTGKDIKLTQGGFFEENGVKKWGKIVMSEISDVYYAFDTLDSKMRSLNDLEIQAFQVGGGTAIYAQFKKQLDDISSYTKEWKEANKDKLNPFELNEEAKNQTIKKYQDFINDLSSKLKSGKFKDNDVEIVNMAIQDAQKSIDDFNGSKIQQEVKKIFTTFAAANKIPLDGMDKLLLGSEEGLTEYSKRIKDLLTDLQERVDLFNKNPMLSPFGKEDISLFQQQIPLIKFQYNKVHVETQKEQNKANKTALDMLKERISLIKETNTEYGKLLKNYSKEESANKIRESYTDTWKELFKGTSMEKFVATVDFDTKGAIKSLEELGKNAAPKLRKEILKAVDGLRAQVLLDVRVERTEKLKSDIEKIFTGYELSLELEKLNIPPDLAKQLFNVDVFNLDQLQKRAQPYLNELKSKGEDQVKIAKDIEKKISDMQYNANVERVKEYSKYLKKTMSDRVNVELETLQKIEDINKIKEFTPKEKEAAKKAVIKEGQEKKDKLVFEDFKGDDLYIKMFEDLDKISTSVLKNMKEKLISLKTSLKDLSPTELKEIASQMQKIDDAIQDRNPFKELIPNIKEYISYLKERRDTERQYKEESAKLIPLEIKSQKADIDLAGAQQEYNISVKTFGINSKQAKLTESILADKTINAQKSKSELDSQKKITKELEKQVNSGKELGDAIKAAFAKAGEYAKDLSSAIGEVAAPLENMFGTMSGSTKDALDSTQEILGGVGEMASGIASGNYLQAAVGAIKTIGAIFAIGDKKKERQIVKETEAVEKLQKAYSKLEVAISDAYSIDTLKASNEAAKSNIKEQIAATERMIKLEEDKKKTDQGRIDEWKNNIEEMKEKLVELEEQRLESLGGFGSEAKYKDAAQQFADAWYEAYKETGDGLSGLEDTFDSFIDNIVKKQLLLRGTEKLLKPLLDMIDGIVDDGIVDLEEQTKLDNQWQEQTKPALDALYKALTESMGIIGGEAELSGLQKGIQGLTEETGSALEALLNSMRFFVADSNLQLKNLYALFTNPEMPNPILAELKAQTVLVRSIYDLFNGMTAVHARLGGRGLKVCLD